MSSYQFNKGIFSLFLLVHYGSHCIDNEVRRKLYLENLANRTPEQKAEEEALFIELKKLEQNERRFKREREDLLRRLAGIDSGLPDVVEDEGGPLSLSIDTSSTKLRRKGAEFDSPSTPSYTPSAVTPKQPTRPQIPQQSAKTAAYGGSYKIVATTIYLTLDRCATLYYKERAVTHHTRNKSCTYSCIFPFVENTSS
jgi:hypothetical protein